MHGAFIVAIVFGGIVLALAVIGATFIMSIKLTRDGISRKDKKYQSNETRMIQEIYQGLSKMEERIETLETILLDREKGKAKNETI